MKLIKKLFLLLLLSLTIFSCKVSEDRAVKQVAKNFLDCLNNHDYTGAKKYALPESASALDMMAMLGAIDSVKKKTETIITGCEINGDKASCRYLKDGKELTLDLAKINKQWLVSFKKEDTPPSMEGSAEEQKKAQADSMAAMQAHIAHEADTVTYFDFNLADMYEMNGSSVMTLELNNKSAYKIQHVWLEIYISNSQGKFVQKKELMFDNIEKSPLSEDASTEINSLHKCKIKLVADRILPNDIGELFIYPKRISMEKDFYNNLYEESDMLGFAKRYIKINNYSKYSVDITF